MSSTSWPSRPTAFPRLAQDQVAALSRLATPVKLAAGETLFAAGDIDVPFFVVASGEVAVLGRAGGRDQTIAVHQPGEFTGDVDMLTGRPAAVSAVARTACEAYRVAAADLRRVVGELPQVGEVLLRAFLMRRELLEESGVAAVRVVGSRFCRDTHRIREFLARNKIPFAWMDLENDPNAKALLERFGVAAGETPLVILGNGRTLRCPSSAAVADALGIRKPLERSVYDLVIVGAGPAGLAAAVYGASEGLKTLILEKIAPGGQAGGSSLIENYMGFPAGLSGADLADRAVVQAHKFGAQFSLPAHATRLRCENGSHLLDLEGGEQVAARCVLVSVGAAYRRLKAEDCARFEGLGLYYAATTVEGELCRSAQVVIVGGGNSAGQAAIFLAERASRVLLLLRGDDLRRNMSEYLARRIEHAPTIEVRRHTEIVRMRGDKWLESVEVRCTRTGEGEVLACPAAFVFIGAVPHTGWLRGQAALDEDGFVKTGPQPGGSAAWPLARAPFLLETSCPGVFAAGDARVSSVKRVASAVGEGAMAVRFAQEYLASA